MDTVNSAQCCVLGRLERNCKTMFFPAKHNTLFWMHGVGKVFDRVWNAF